VETILVKKYRNKINLNLEVSITHTVELITIYDMKYSENLRCSNINGAMHKLLVGECLTEAKSVH